MASPLLIWALTDGRAGNAAQVLGVAEALNHPFVVKDIRYNPLAKLPAAITGAGVFGLTPETRMTLTPPWPDLVISAGRRTAPAARWIKRRTGKPVLLAHMMYPGRRGASDFDLIAVPHHDRDLPGGGNTNNVMRVTGAPHRVSAPGLEAAAEQWKNPVGGIPRPFIALLVGGATHSKPFPVERAADLGRRVYLMAAEVGGSVLLATSRRTGAAAEQALEHVVPEPRRAFFWGGGGENPYMGFSGARRRCCCDGRFRIHVFRGLRFACAGLYLCARGDDSAKSTNGSTRSFMISVSPALSTDTLRIGPTRRSIHPAR